jgi:hypothetical protein
MAGFAQLGPIAGAISAVLLGATGIAQLGIANAERAKVKGLKSGGFTGTGSDDDITDYVHANEFVGNAKSVRNPSVKQAYDVINMAQKSGTIGTLNLPAALGAISGGSSSSLPTREEMPAGQRGFDPELKALIASNIAINKKMLDDGIRAYNPMYTNNDDGLKQLLDKANQFEESLDA